MLKMLTPRNIIILLCIYINVHQKCKTEQQRQQHGILKTFIQDQLLNNQQTSTMTSLHRSIAQVCQQIGLLDHWNTLFFSIQTIDDIFNLADGLRDALTPDKPANQQSTNTSDQPAQTSTTDHIDSEMEENSMDDVLLDVDTLEKNKFPESSSIGIFLTKLCLSFDLMSFEAISEVFSSFKQSAEDIQVMDSSATNSPQILPESIWSNDEANRFLDHLAGQLDSSLNIQMDKVQFHSRLHELSKNLVDISKIYYAQYLYAKYHDDFEAALENLYRYFDYTLLNGGRSKYHYALLSLATLHLKFGHVEEAKSTLNEATHVARINRDEDCLSYALTWLKRIEASNPSDHPQHYPNSHRMVHDSKLHDLLGLNLLFDAKEALMQGKHDQLVQNALNTVSVMQEQYQINHVVNAYRLVETMYEATRGKLSEAIQHLEETLQNTPSESEEYSGSAEDTSLCHALYAFLVSLYFFFIVLNATTHAVLTEI